ncbi:MAG: AAA family ATPase [Proteobacteria bacterium]|nr:AAA family ATPase [Pseudomonadota bacterium]NIS60172.1 AAA family ATPase [Pseudomonadota bacterium]
MKCPECGEVNSLGRRFCGECGYHFRQNHEPPPIDHKKPPPYTPKHTDEIIKTRSALEGERKIVTVLFADVAGSTRIFEKLDPEEVHNIMDGCFKIMMDEVHNYGGTVNQFTGDGIMALFGAPLAHEDHARRACYAALGIQRALEAYAEKVKARFGTEFKMRIGLNSGSVVVGSIGDDSRRDYTAEGDTVNLASRIETLADPGNILISNNTYHRVSHDFEFLALGKFKIKGKEKLHDVYRLVDKTSRPQIDSEWTIHSEMVGRDRELDRLELHVLKAKNGEGSIVNIVGEAGIGKSRLIAELKKRETLRGTLVLEARAVSIGGNLSFYPIIEMIKGWAGIQEDDLEAEAGRKLESKIRAIHPQKTNEIFPFIATMMGIKLSGKHSERVKRIEGKALESLIRKSLRDLIIKVSESFTLILIIEDLHWADNTSIELLITMFRLAESNKIMFINLFRPHHERTSDRLLRNIIENYPSLHKEIYIQPLNTSESDLLIDNLLKAGGLPRDIRNSIHRRSEGNPYFIEEVIRSFIDQGVVERKNGGLAITRKIESVLIPNTIQELLISRIDHLEEQTKILLKTASVIGRKFFYRILAKVAHGVENIDNRLRYLKEIQLIQEIKRMEETEYIFKHALVQETMYESILRQKRRELHLKVAESIEKVFGERLHEFYGMLASHYSRGEDLDKAEEYLTKAGEEALKSSASSEALHYYKEAFNIYELKYGETADPEKVAMFDKNIALALYNRGQYEEAVEYFDKALAYYWGESPKHSFLTAFTFVSAVFHFFVALYFPSLKFRGILTQKDTEAVDLFYKKCEALVIINPRRFFIESFYFFRKLTSFNLTKLEQATGILVSASCLFSFSGLSFKVSRKILNSVENRMGEYDVKQLTTYDLMETQHNYLEGNWQRLRGHDYELVKKNLNIGEIFLASHHLYWHGCPIIYQGFGEVAGHLVDELNEISDVYKNDLSKLLKYLLNASLLVEYRKLHEALAEIQEAIEFIHKKGSDISLIILYSIKSFTHLMMKDPQEARKFLQYADKVRSGFKAVPIQLAPFYRSQFAYLLQCLEESLKKGKQWEASEYRNKAGKSGKVLLKISRKAALHRTETYKMMGVYFWLINKQRKALNWWNKAVREGERLGARLELSRSYLELGKRLLEDKSIYQEINGSRAETYLEKARALFEEMELQWDLDEMMNLVADHGLSVPNTRGNE